MKKSYLVFGEPDPWHLWSLLSAAPAAAPSDEGGGLGFYPMLIIERRESIVSESDVSIYHSSRRQRVKNDRNCFIPRRFYGGRLVEKRCMNYEFVYMAPMPYQGNTRSIIQSSPFFLSLNHSSPCLLSTLTTSHLPSAQP